MAFYDNIQRRKEFLGGEPDKKGRRKPVTDSQLADLRIDESRAGARSPVVAGTTGFAPRQINYQPQQFSGLGQMPSIRQASLNTVLQPFSQPNWGLGQVDPRYLTSSGFGGSGLAGSQGTPGMVQRFAGPAVYNIGQASMASRFR